MKLPALLMRQEAKEYPSFPLGNRLYIRLDLYSRGKTFHTPSEEKEDYPACMLRKAEQTLLPRRRRQDQAEVVCQFEIKSKFTST